MQDCEERFSHARMVERFAKYASFFYSADDHQRVSKMQGFAGWFVTSLEKTHHTTDHDACKKLKLDNVFAFVDRFKTSYNSKITGKLAVPCGRNELAAVECVASTLPATLAWFETQTADALRQLLELEHFFNGLDADHGKHLQGRHISAGAPRPHTGGNGKRKRAKCSTSPSPTALVDLDKPAPKRTLSRGGKQVNAASMQQAEGSRVLAATTEPQHASESAHMDDEEDEDEHPMQLRLNRIIAQADADKLADPSIDKDDRVTQLIVAHCDLNGIPRILVDNQLAQPGV